jgi:betaine-aldehyde dehydrogenase
VGLAVDAAERAFPGWRGHSGRERGDYLRAFARALTKRRAVLVDLQMRNNGKPRSEADVDVSDAIATFDYYAELARDLDTRQGSPVTLPDAAYAGATRFEPLGPVGMIVPWNFPLVTSAWKIAPALAAGCTVVLKTSEYTPLMELVYADIAAEHSLPAGVLNVLTGAGVTGAALSGNPHLAKLSFTGSNAVGSKVMVSAAARCIPVSLELGGKSPIVVFADADLEQAVETIIAGIFYNCGQMCSATSRLVLDAGIVDDLMHRLIERCRRLKVDSPFVDGCDMGPLTTAPQYRKVLATFARAEAEGAGRVTGGEAIPNGDGFFVAPTIYADVPRESFLWREEIFGPVLCVRSFGDEAEAIELANDSDYGLVATVVSADIERAERVAARLDAGHIWINSLQIIFPESAWGGFKASGIGRELGPWGLHAFLGVKHISRRRAGFP